MNRYDEINMKAVISPLQSPQSKSWPCKINNFPTQNEGITEQNPTPKGRKNTLQLIVSAVLG